MPTERRTKWAAVTNLAGAAALVIGMITAWMVTGKPDATLSGGAAIAGLVAITAGSAFVENWAAIVIGAVAGALYVFSVLLLDRLKIDDPVGAIPCHAFMGAFGTLATGIFASPRLVEITGVGKPGLIYTGSFSSLVFKVLVFLPLLGLFF